jgi:hypothetical protein
MASSILVASFLCLIAVVSAYPRDFAEQSARQRFRRDFTDCKPVNEECRFFPPCCGSNVCYYENGYSVTRKGVCVACIDRAQVCQGDYQCCEPLVCQKTRGRDVNGVCGPKKANGDECHDNDQCESEFCEIGFYENLVMMRGGVCADPSRR